MVKRNRKKRIRFKIETKMVVGIQDEIEGANAVATVTLPVFMMSVAFFFYSI